MTRHDQTLPEQKEKKKIMAEIVATNVVASRPPNGNRLQPGYNDRSLGLPRESIVNFPHPHLCHHSNDIVNF